MSTKLKAVLLLGPEIKRTGVYISENSNLLTDLQALYAKESYLMLGGSQKTITFDDLFALRGRIDSNTRIDIAAHGNNSPGGHFISLDGVKAVAIKRVFEIFAEINNGAPLAIHLWSCYGRAAKTDIKFLPKGSALIIHATDNAVTTTVVGRFSIKKAITNMQMSDKVKSPYTSFMEDFVANVLQPVTVVTYLGDLKYGFKIEVAINPSLQTVLNDPKAVLAREALKFKNHIYALNWKAKAIQDNVSKASKVFLGLQELPDIKITEQDIEEYRFGYFLYKCGANAVKEIEIALKNDKSKNAIEGMLDKKLDGNSPLLNSAQGGNSKLTELLLKLGANPDIQDNEGDTPLRLAAQNGHEEVIDILLAYKANPNITTITGNTAISLSSGLGYTKIVTSLLKHYANPNVLNNNGSSAIEMAAQNGHIEVVRCLLTNEFIKADPNSVDNEGNSALMKAIFFKHIDIAKLLLDHNANPNHVANDGLSPLFLAIKIQNKEMVEYLFRKGAMLDLAENHGGYAALHLASSICNKEMVRVLLNDHNANPNISSNNQHTPRIVANHYCNKEDRDHIINLLEQASNRRVEITENDEITIKEEDYQGVMCPSLQSFDEFLGKCYDYQHFS